MPGGLKSGRQLGQGRAAVYGDNIGARHHHVIYAQAVKALGGGDHTALRDIRRFWR